MFHPQTLLLQHDLLIQTREKERENLLAIAVLIITAVNQLLNLMWSYIFVMTVIHLKISQYINMHFKSWISDWYCFVLTEMCIVLLKISDKFLFGFQLVSQAAELFLMGLPVTLDLLLNSILNTNTRIKIKINIQTEKTHLYVYTHFLPSPHWHSESHSPSPLHELSLWPQTHTKH